MDNKGSLGGIDQGMWGKILSLFGGSQQQQTPSANKPIGSFGDFGLGDILGGIEGLAGLYFGNEKLGLAKKQYGTNTAFANTNLANQAKLTNNSLEAAYKQALASKAGTAEGATMASLADYMKKAGVNGSPIA